MNNPDKQVAVIVPAYNSADTIRETLESVCCQTWTNLDIIVVDDGSTDNTAFLVSKMAVGDQRIRLVRSPNGGVAAARNLGAAKSKAPFIAFLDADDLWAPEKIAAQMELADVQHHGPSLVYCWFAQIDRNSRVYPVGQQPVIEGRIWKQLIRSNFVGNGSSMLMAREVFDNIGGFDTSLAEAGLQGCEDLLFLLHAARQFPFKVANRHLLGYRLSHTSMSASVERMLGSFDYISDIMDVELAEHSRLWKEHRNDLVEWLANRAAMSGNFRAVLKVLRLSREKTVASALALLPKVLETYVRAYLVPEWVKGLSRRVGLIKTRPLYLEVNW